MPGWRRLPTRCRAIPRSSPGGGRPDAARRRRRKPTEIGARVDQRGEQFGPQLQPLDELGVPFAGVHPEQPGCRGVRALGHRRPVSQNASRSGMRRKESASSRRPAVRSAVSWKSVLNGRCCSRRVRTAPRAGPSRGRSRRPRPCARRGGSTAPPASGPRSAGRSRSPTSRCRCWRARLLARRRGESLDDAAVELEDAPVQAVGRAHRPVRESGHVTEAQLSVRTCPSSTRPLVAPRSTAATVPRSPAPSQLIGGRRPRHPHRPGCGGRSCATGRAR